MFFSLLSDDIVLNIIERLEDDPRNWSRLSCVSPKFRLLIQTICIPNKCLQNIPSLTADILSGADKPPAGWASLFNLAVSCPGLRHAGILLQNPDTPPDLETATIPSLKPDTPLEPVDANCAWSLYDDLYFDTVYDNNDDEIAENVDNDEVGEISKGVFKKGRTSVRFEKAHLASGIWNLSREQGIKLLASRFRGDSLYICDWPGCLHVEEKRNYMLFRGVFKNFKQTRVWRTIKDGDRRSRVEIGCAFCECEETWDLHSAFCLRRVFGFHDDGEPVVRAFVCENGHVSGAWTDFPLYT